MFEIKHSIILRSKIWFNLTLHSLKLKVRHGGAFHLGNVLGIFCVLSTLNTNQIDIILQDLIGWTCTTLEPNFAQTELTSRGSRVFIEVTLKFRKPWNILRMARWQIDQCIITTIEVHPYKTSLNTEYRLYCLRFKKGKMEVTRPTRYEKHDVILVTVSDWARVSILWKQIKEKSNLRVWVAIVRLKSALIDNSDCRALP